MTISQNITAMQKNSALECIVKKRLFCHLTPAFILAMCTYIYTPPMVIHASVRFLSPPTTKSNKGKGGRDHGQNEEIRNESFGIYIPNFWPNHPKDKFPNIRTEPGHLHKLKTSKSLSVPKSFTSQSYFAKGASCLIWVLMTKSAIFF